MVDEAIRSSLRDQLIHELARSAAARDRELPAVRREREGRQALRREAGLAAMDEYEREHGAFTPEELAAADAFIAQDFGPLPGNL